MNISFSATTEQFINKTKHCTRRIGWRGVKPGQILRGIEKGQGLKKGEKVKHLHEIIVLEVNREPLIDIIKHPIRINPPRIVEQYIERTGGRYPTECVLEGFPELSPLQFVQMFMKMNKCIAEAPVTRILYDFVEES